MTEEKKKGRKHDQVLEGARQVFVERGFEGASVDEISRVAGVSKATLYSYFPNKESMFIAVARSKYEAQTDLALEELDFDAGPQECLTFAARTMVQEFNTDFSRSVYRIAVGEAQRFPELAQEYLEAGPRLVRNTLKAYLNYAVSRGELMIDNMDLAADQFIEMCKATLNVEYILGIREEFSDLEKFAVADETVKTFLARYGV